VAYINKRIKNFNLGTYLRSCPYKVTTLLTKGIYLPLKGNICLYNKTSASTSVDVTYSNRINKIINLGTSLYHQPKVITIAR